MTPVPAFHASNQESLQVRPDYSRMTPKDNQMNQIGHDHHVGLVRARFPPLLVARLGRILVPFSALL